MSAEHLTERESLTRTFLDLGPQAPTILPGWDAEDLLEHLLLREGAPHLIAGRKLPGPWRSPAGWMRSAVRESC